LTRRASLTANGTRAPSFRRSLIALVIHLPLRTMRIDNAFSYMMERRAGSSKVATPARYDADDCHEYVWTISSCKCTYSPSFVSKSRVFTKGILLRPCKCSPYLCAFSSLWIYRVQGETERDFRRGDKRCVDQKSFNVRTRWKVGTDWVGADVLVVAPTGMGKVSVSYCVWTCSCCKILEHLLSSPCDRPSCSYTPFCPHKRSV
jgi:hypothetical protein